MLNHCPHRASLLLRFSDAIAQLSPCKSWAHSSSNACLAGEVVHARSDGALTALGGALTALAWASGIEGFLRPASHHLPATAPVGMARELQRLHLVKGNAQQEEMRRHGGILR